MSSDVHPGGKGQAVQIPCIIIGIVTVPVSRRSDSRRRSSSGFHGEGKFTRRVRKYFSFKFSF
jgi:hypothetical protein